jgi:hypothetical protein
VTSRRVGYAGTLSDSFMEFDHVTRGSTPDEIVQLLAHTSATVRGYAARYVIESLSNRVEAVAPLLHDDAPLEWMSGCTIAETTVAGLVFEELLGSAHPQSTHGPDVRALLRRATVDPTVGPFRARGLSVLYLEDPALACNTARVLLARHPDTPEALRELARDLRASDVPLVAKVVAVTSYVFPSVAEAIGEVAARSPEIRADAIVVLEALRTRKGSAIRDAADKALAVARRATEG